MSKIKYISEKEIKINLPDFYQETGYSCGAAALLSILKYYTDGPINEKLLRWELGTKKSGTDPYQIIKVVKKYGLKHKEFRKMTISVLKKCIDMKRPVMIMLQAYGKVKNYMDYMNDYDDGHWIIATGYDQANIYFEDPSLFKTKGYIKIKELDARWHDIESYSAKDKIEHHSDHYGLAIWGKKPSKQFRAEEIP